MQRITGTSLVRACRSARSSVAFRFYSDEGAIRRGGTQFSEKERAIENQYFHQKDIEKLEEYRKKLAESQKSLGEVAKRMEHLEKELKELKGGK